MKNSINSAKKSKCSYFFNILNLLINRISNYIHGILYFYWSNKSLDLILKEKVFLKEENNLFEISSKILYKNTIYY